MFRYCIYGYLNAKFIVKNRSKEEELKSLKKKAVMAYIKGDGYPLIIQNIIIAILRVSELPLSIVVISLTYVKYFFCKNPLGDNNQIHNRLCFFVKEPQMQSLIDKAGLKTEKMLMVTYPGEKTEKQFDIFNRVRLVDFLSYYDLFVLFLNSIEYCCFFYFKYNDDFLNRLYSCYDFFATMLFVEKLSKDNILLCTETYTRWAFMMSDPNHKSVFLQHGMIGDGICFLKKVGSPQFGYFINESQKYNCCYSLFRNKPVSYIMAGLAFTSNDKLIKNGKRHILLVCRYTDLCIEEKIVKTVMDNGHYNLYVKPHPLFSCEQYKRLSKEMGCVLLEKNDFPKVDIVISYKSTLALEYADAGIVVLRHDLLSLKEIYELLISNYSE